MQMEANDYEHAVYHVEGSRGLFDHKKMGLVWILFNRAVLTLSRVADIALLLLAFHIQRWAIIRWFSVIIFMIPKIRSLESFTPAVNTVEFRLLRECRNMFSIHSIASDWYWNQSFYLLACRLWDFLVLASRCFRVYPALLVGPLWFTNHDLLELRDTRSISLRSRGLLGLACFHFIFALRHDWFKFNNNRLNRKH